MCLLAFQELVFMTLKSCTHMFFIRMHNIMACWKCADVIQMAFHLICNVIRSIH
jgi:hypothetical protein